MTVGPVAGEVTFELIAPDEFSAVVPALAEILADAVDSGASVNFIKPFSLDDAATWWSAKAADVAAGTIRPVVAREGGRIVGVVLLVLSRNPNSPHRAEVMKVLVHRQARGRGVGGGLITALEQVARDEGRWLLILDTQSGSDAERMYRRLGWREWGVVPDHSLRADGSAYLPTTFFYKDLRGQNP